MWCLYFLQECFSAMKKRSLFILAVALCVITCKGKEEQLVSVSSVSIYPASTSLDVGESVDLQIIITPSNASYEEVVWSSSQNSIATVDKNGSVTAIAEGKAVIKATAGGKTGSCEVTINKKYIPVISVTVEKSSLELIEGDKKQINAQVYPEDATNNIVLWKSTSPSIATVDKDGTIEAVSKGNTYIVASADNITDTCFVTVFPKTIPVESISLDITEMSLKESESKQLVATIFPDNASDKTVKWESSNNSVVSVSNGKVTGLLEGKATIFAIAGEKQAQCNVEVIKNIIPVTSITLTPQYLPLVIGQKRTLSASIMPSNATDQTIVWTSSDESVASVESGVVTALHEGETVITAKIGNITGEARVKVDYIHVSGISLSTYALELYVGQQERITAVISPENATYPHITWQTTDERIVAVSTDGVISAIGPGTATITATADGSKRTCEVTVKNKLEKLILPAKDSLYVGMSKTIGVTAYPDGTIEDESLIKWESSDPTVISLSKDSGQRISIAGKKYGTAIISASVGAIKVESLVRCMERVTDFVFVATPPTRMLLGTESNTSIAFIPENSMPVGKATYTSSNNNVVSTDNSGSLYARQLGRSTIKVTVNNGLRYINKNFSVRVYSPVESIQITPASISILQFKTVQLDVIVTPANADDIVWTSSNTDIVQVDGNGVISTHSTGEATVTAACGDKQATCSVVVYSGSSGSHEGTGTEKWN